MTKKRLIVYCSIWGIGNIIIYIINGGYWDPIAPTFSLFLSIYFMIRYQN